MYKTLLDVTAFSEVIIKAITNGHFFESYNDKIFEVLDKHSTEEKNKTLPHGSGLSEPESTHFFSISESLHAKNEFKLEYSKKLVGLTELSFSDYCNSTLESFQKYKNTLPRLNGNIIFYSLQHLKSVENDKFS